MALVPGCLWAQSPAIRLDQVGYRPAAPKSAVIVSETKTDDFVVRRIQPDTIVFRGKLNNAGEDPLSGDHVRLADFTAFQRPGEYVLEIEGVGKSDAFSIADDVYSRTYYLAMRSFYGQRCGTSVDLGPEFSQFHYSACHQKGAFHASSGEEGTHASTKGWHDAGDYGRYVVNSGISTGTLLWAWELYGNNINNISLKIPESGGKTPDILSEIRWNLDWMLTMQSKTGGVWHKQTSEKFAGFVMPDKDPSVSVVIGTGEKPFTSSCATGDFAAVMATAARVYQPWDSAFSTTARKAAENAWTWLEQNPSVLFSNPKSVATGAYGDKDCSDEALWAAAELYRTTSESKYQEYFLANYQKQLPRLKEAPPSWASVGALALWTYALSSAENKNAEADSAIRDATAQAAQAIAARIDASDYRIAMRPEDYVWGSNGVAANYGMQLLISSVLLKEPAYAQLAQEHLHYLLGRNAFSISWVTHAGKRWFQHPHHRPSGADGVSAPWPGFLSGGPNRGRNDPAMQAKLDPQTPPMKMWLDEEPAYAANEIAINWNAPLVFLLAGSLPAR